MTKYHYNRGSTGRAACNKNLVLATGKVKNRCMSAGAITRNRWRTCICKHCLRIVRKENGSSNWKGVEANDEAKKSEYLL